MESWCWWLLCLCLPAQTDGMEQNLTSCNGVRRLLQLQQIDATTGVLDTPGTGLDLQVCLNHSVTCCTRKVEVRYHAVLNQDILNLLQTFSSNLKLLITQNIAALQNLVDSVVHKVQDDVFSHLKVLYGDLALPAFSPLAELFTDVGLYVLGVEFNLDKVTDRFFYELFPLVYDQLEEPGMAPLDPVYKECVQAVGRRITAYGNAPARLAFLLKNALVAEREFLQAMHFAVEVVDTTDHAQLSHECRIALIRMRYCPLCQALTDSKPCIGYCLNVLRGCLASLAEVDAHWQDFVLSMQSLAEHMHDGKDLEYVLAFIPSLITDAASYTKKNAALLTSQVRSECGEPVRSKFVQQKGTSDSIHRQTAERNKQDTLRYRRQEFLRSLRHYRTFYGGLADQMCVREIASTDGSPCWNGLKVVKSYTKRVVVSGKRAKEKNPEVQVNEADPVIMKVIYKLKHFNQLLKMQLIPKLDTLDQIEMGSGDMDVGFSGQCDDEDGCGGSGGRAGETQIIETPELSEQNPGENSYHGIRTQAAGRTLRASGCRNTHGTLSLLSLVCMLLMLWR